MKKNLLIASTLLLSSSVLAENTSGKMGISLTIVPTCSVTTTDNTPQVECGNGTVLQPKMSHSKRVVDDRESELITVEW
ncbi:MULTISPECIES: hypothetical protein [Serratia]|uniref:hypothetical protein n=1 Tax=Serratia TaxID=613 RepID=UPI0018ECE0A6|nr:MULTISPECIES: hypothetical protein [Serratia]MDQ7210073.1 hypothetical protein [Serratia fonticola]CAI2099871.1 Uncharacterised protein [Serratia fonticola]HBE9079829.1 hypothetical protein [Serratia fonticola]HBE9090101.1 hypothetical protein [Serratia fonticola]HBE9152867.1 hypothetical protein [Serratia fonticola]